MDELIPRVSTCRVTIMYRFQLSMPEDQLRLVARGWLLCTQIVSQVLS